MFLALSHPARLIRNPWLTCIVAVWIVAGCATPTQHRTEANETAAEIIGQQQTMALGRTEPFWIETPADTLRRRLLAVQKLMTSGPSSIGSDRLHRPEFWPEKGVAREPFELEPVVGPFGTEKPLKLSLVDALKIGARNSRAYQSQKEIVFLTALDYDLEIDDFRNTYTGLIDALVSADEPGETGLDVGIDTSISRKFESGAILTGRLAVDLVKLLSDSEEGSVGLIADATVTVPLLRGAGRHIVTEPMKQAERDVVYEIWGFERFKRVFVVQIADQYLRVLQDLDRILNEENNYRRQVVSVRRARRLAQAGRLNKIQLDQARQAELEARQNWILAQLRYERSLDRFKLTLGLPSDARIELDRGELNRLADSARRALGGADTEGTPEQPVGADDAIVLQGFSRAGAGAYELPEPKAVRLALDNRLDLLTNHGRVYDSQRSVVVAANALEAGLELVGSVQSGESRSIATADLSGAKLRFDQGAYAVCANIELPWERTAERNAYRQSYINLERAVRNVQELEDQIKLDVRDRLRTLVDARESYKIQNQSVLLAEQRVKSNKMFLDAGRGNVQIRDVLEAEDALLNAQNGLTAALVGYRVAELQLQSDLGLLRVDETGLWEEFDPASLE